TSDVCETLRSVTCGCSPRSNERRRRRVEDRVGGPACRSLSRGIGRPVMHIFRLGRPLQPLLHPRAGDEGVAIAEAHAGPEGTMLVPELVELPVEPTDVVADGGVVLGGQPVPELGSLLAEPLDLRMDCRQRRCHTPYNVVLARGIPQETLRRSR